MKITVVNGTEKHGVTYRLTELFLSNFDGAVITRFYLPKDCPAFCSGCASCCLKGEDTCKDANFVGRIEQSLRGADLIVFTSPAYVMHASGGMKALLDHLCYRWMPHRPMGEMFTKRAVVITQCLGAGAKSTARDIQDSLRWWGVTDISTFCGRLMGDIEWDNLTEKRRKSLTEGIKKLSEKCARKNYSRPARTGLKVKFKFYVCRMMQKSLYKSNPDYTDARYWQEQGWLAKSRPWKY